MVTKEELHEKYSELSNGELLEIIDNKHGYTDVAVSVALSEISKRDIDEKQIAQYKEKQLYHLEDVIEKNFTDDLAVYQKLLFYLFWLPLLTFTFKNNYAREGNMLKLRQASFYSWCGFGIAVLTAILEMLIDLSNLSSGIFMIICFPGILYYDLTIRKPKLYALLFSLFGQADNENDVTASQDDNE